tara:strand:+ start:44 stop:190 length:147 start_codon:yes stop_codon:yes gene_type:complete
MYFADVIQVSEMHSKYKFTHQGEAAPASPPAKPAAKKKAAKKTTTEDE